MSASSPRAGRLPPFRTLLVILCVFVAVVAVVRLAIGGGSPAAQPLPAASAAETPGAPSPVPSASASPAHEKPSPRPEQHRRERYHPTGHLEVADGKSEVQGGGAPTRFLVEVERGIKVDPDVFARDVERVLFDRRSWPGAFQRVDHGAVAFRVTLASPELTDELCAPLETAGIYSCFQQGRSVLNAMRWKRGADAYGDDLRAYRIYMVNHEVGHALGYDHLECPGAGQKAPVMMQQTKGVAPCEANPWP